MNDATKTNELLLIDFRPEAPLIRTKRDFEGTPPGTLGYIAGVDGIFLKVRLAGADSDTLMLNREVESV